MAMAQPVTSRRMERATEPQALRSYPRLGLLSGLLMGVALALGAWALEAVRATRVPLLLPYGSLLIASLFILLLFGFVGWLSARLARSWLTVILWLFAAILAALTIAYQPFYGRTLVVWLTDLRFWGREIFPYTSGGIIGLVLTGFAIILVLVLFAMLQDYRLQGAQQELQPGGGVSMRTLLILLVPVPFVFLAAFVTQMMMANPTADAALQVHEAIRTGRTYEGDLFQLGLETGINYNAIRGVREQMSENYTLQIGAIEPETSSIFVVAHFDNGAWINCRVINNQLNFCYDAAPAYNSGLVGVIVGEPAPEQCRTCRPEVTEEWRQWLQAQRDSLGPAPHVERLAQWGGSVLMRLSAPDDNYAIECWLEGVNPVWVDSCATVP